MAVLSVLLFRNDGQLEALDATPFHVNTGHDFRNIKQECYKALYGKLGAAPRLFTELGLEIPSADYIVQMQSLVVSGGEPFVHPFRNQLRGSSEQVSAIEDMLTNIYADDLSAVVNDTDIMRSYLKTADSMAHQYMNTSFATRAQQAFTELFPSEAEPGSPVDPKLQALFNEIQFPTVALAAPPSFPLSPVQSSSRWSHSSYDSPLMELSDVRASSNGMQQSPGNLNGYVASPASSHGSDPRSPYAATPSLSGPAAPMQSSFSFQAQPNASTARTDSPPRGGRERQSSADSVHSQKSTGIKPTITKSDAHKASEMRSRNKLKESIAELVVSVPTLRNEKNPTRAVIIKKANEFVQASKRANDRLTEENTAYREQIAQLQMERLKLQHEKQLSSIVTVEMVDLDIKYVFVDHMWEIMMGYRREDVVGKAEKEVVGCNKCPLMIDRCQEIASSICKNNVWHGLVLGKRKDGRAFACEATVTPMTDSSGKVYQYIMVRKNFHLISDVECREICAGMAAAPEVRPLEASVETVMQMLTGTDIDGRSDMQSLPKPLSSAN